MVSVTRNEAKATPLYPICKMSIGVKIQVNVVQISIKFKVVFTRPVASNTFTKIPDKEETAALRQKKVKLKTAGSHLCHFTKYSMI